MAKGIFLSPMERSHSKLQSKPSSKCALMDTNKICTTQIPLSPPVSPETKKAAPREAITVMNDAILCRAGPSAEDNGSSTECLFRMMNESCQTIENQATKKVTDVFRMLSPPQMSEYKFALEFKSQIGKAFGANRRKWAQRELAQLREDNMLKSGTKHLWQCTNTISVSNVRFNIKKTSSTQILPERTKSDTLKAKRASRIRKKIRHGEVIDNNKKVVREDKDFDSLVDYCPPVSSLPSKMNSLKIEWKGLPIDLKSDPFAHLLHRDELQLAANLRLDCATYLTSKRRIFISRVAAYRIGKEFRKTDAQQACKIDVNKASKLWQAFDNVGWFDSKWVPD
ncbi:hypothetical protein GcM3_012027 [Golovinomyces cichoracearum]|uniref:SWIRM domain-containing protein n=1 Tax=Golovinomyces cichoracearum TaxID=62708 RepID=A0A420J9L6_9PEZI|nr:hypothetical protein GcM3_012027 [Golovinomyces cichoracearum]